MNVQLRELLEENMAFLSTQQQTGVGSSTIAGQAQGFAEAVRGIQNPAVSHQRVMQLLQQQRQQQQCPKRLGNNNQELGVLGDQARDYLASLLLQQTGVVNVPGPSVGREYSNEAGGAGISDDRLRDLLQQLTRVPGQNQGLAANMIHPNLLQQQVLLNSAGGGGAFGSTQPQRLLHHLNMERNATLDRLQHLQQMAGLDNVSDAVGSDGRRGNTEHHQSNDHSSDKNNSKHEKNNE